MLDILGNVSSMSWAPGWHINNIAYVSNMKTFYHDTQNSNSKKDKVHIHAPQNPFIKTMYKKKKNLDEI